MESEKGDRGLGEGNLLLEGVMDTDATQSHKYCLRSRESEARLRSGGSDKRRKTQGGV
jgi:hypothetical protein